MIHTNARIKIFSIYFYIFVIYFVIIVNHDNLSILSDIINPLFILPEL